MDTEKRDLNTGKMLIESHLKKKIKKNKKSVDIQKVTCYTNKVAWARKSQMTMKLTHLAYGL